MTRFNLARLLAALAAASLLVASMIHFGMFVDGYAHDGAALPEAVIGVVMVGSLFGSLASPPWSRRSLIGGLAFGLLGSLVGLTLVAIGVGPRTFPDVVYHVLLVTTLIVGLVVAVRDGAGSGS